MKKTFLLACLFLTVCLNVNSQITKKNWLFGGNVSFSSSKYSSNIGSNSYTVIRIVGNAGYFIIDKLAVGLKPNLYFDHTQTTTNNVWSKAISIGPFVRYYALPKTAQTNLFFEGSYAYGTNGLTNQNTINSNSYSFLLGPEFFLNSSVGLELAIGYTHTKSNYPGNSKTNIFQVGIGLQFHLEKE